MARRRPEGIIARHSYGCPARWDVGSEKGPCRCSPRYQAQVWSPRDGKRISRTFPTQAAPRPVRHDASVALQRGRLLVGGGAKLSEAATDWLEAAEGGLVRATARATPTNPRRCAATSSRSGPGSCLRSATSSSRRSAARTSSGSSTA